MKETFTRVKTKPNTKLKKWEKISASYLFDKILISRAYKELKKQQKIQLKYGQLI